MGDKCRQVERKSPQDILDDVFAGCERAAADGPGATKKYLLRFLGNYNSIPNAVKFFIYDHLAEASYRDKDMGTCAEAVEKAHAYLVNARDEAGQSFKRYRPSIRFIDRGIALHVDSGEFEKAIVLCEVALALDLGKLYETKKSSIERML